MLDLINDCTIRVIVLCYSNKKGAPFDRNYEKGKMSKIYSFR